MPNNIRYSTNLTVIWLGGCGDFCWCGRKGGGFLVCWQCEQELFFLIVTDSESSSHVDIYVANVGGFCSVFEVLDRFNRLIIGETLIFEIEFLKKFEF